MKFKILKQKKFSKGKYWILAELKLKDYVESLSEENFNFEVQRKIVKNKYLDSILTTIELGEPLPNITLAYNDTINIEGNSIELMNEKLDILDGLQRTYRLWAFWIIFNKIKTDNYSNLREAISSIKSQYPDFFENGIVDSKFFKSNFPNGKINVDFEEKYSDFDIYFTIWTNLNESDLVKKMLILNAGHKAVSTQHQFEILFLSLWKSLKQKLKGISIVREKEHSFNAIKRGERVTGEYLFSTIITSLMSLVIAKPQRISSDIIYKYDLINDIEEGSSLKFAEIIFNSEFIKELLKKLLIIDNEIERLYGNTGVSWFGKDTTLNGMFAGVGQFLKLNEIEENEQVEEKILGVFDVLKNEFPKDLNLVKFNQQYDNLSGRSVNIGNLIRTVVMKYTLNRLNKEETSWNSLFNQEMKK